MIDFYRLSRVNVLIKTPLTFLSNPLKFRPPYFHVNLMSEFVGSV
ncbi:homogentisate 1,2-dioxygenase domain-containing protein [Vibrio profundum]